MGNNCCRRVVETFSEYDKASSNNKQMNNVELLTVSPKCTSPDSKRGSDHEITIHSIDSSIKKDSPEVGINRADSNVTTPCTVAVSVNTMNQAKVAEAITTPTPKTLHQVAELYASNVINASIATYVKNASDLCAVGGRSKQDASTSDTNSGKSKHKAELIHKAWNARSRDSELFRIFVDNLVRRIMQEALNRKGSSCKLVRPIPEIRVECIELYEEESATDISITESSEEGATDERNEDSTEHSLDSNEIELENRTISSALDDFSTTEANRILQIALTNLPYAFKIAVK